MADFVLASLRGGVNLHDPKMALADDQCVIANNVEFVRSMLGERRRGTAAVTLPSSLSGKERISFLHRHVPGTDDTAAELWAFGFTAGGSGVLSRKTSSWTDVTLLNTTDLTGFYPYQWQAASFKGAIFIAKKTNKDRLHMVPAGSTTERMAGLAQPNAPTVADQGSGTLTGTRYYRVRMTKKSGSTVIVRSEPSDSVSITPSGSGSAVRVTKPTTIEDATDWEIEASKDDVNFFVIGTAAVGTTTFDDDQDYATGYAQDFELSEDIGNYTLWWSPRYLAVDDDRLLVGGSYEQSDLSSTVGWSPSGNAEGVGNAERYELQNDPTVNLDGLDGGPLTGLTRAVSGEIWATKFSRIYKLVRKGSVKSAYDPICMTTERGALHGSHVLGVDPQGRPCLYVLDPSVGPLRIGIGGIKQCGVDISGKRTDGGWAALNLDATKVVCSGVYYPTTRQVIWNIATSGSNVPNLAIVLQTNEQVETDKEGLRRGWSTWDGERASGLAMCLFATNINSNTTRNRTLVPFIGVEGGELLHMTDTGVDDAGTTYVASIRTKPHKMKTLLQKFGVKAAALCAKAIASSQITVKLIRDFGLDTQKTVSNQSLAASAAGETDVIKFLNDFAGSEMRVAEIIFEDATSPTARFELNELALIEDPQEKTGGR
jgi:hypothetical protein